MENQVDVNLLLTIIGAKEVAIAQLQQALAQANAQLKSLQQPTEVTS
jgi:hypothetical protein